MPIYEYHCESCSHELEALQKMSDTPLSLCPACGKPALKKVLSAAAFHLKGSGWYATDFKGDNKKTPGETGKSETRQAADKSASQAATKPAASGTSCNS